jgi:hypothetical protein
LTIIMVALSFFLSTTFCSQTFCSQRPLSSLKALHGFSLLWTWKHLPRHTHTHTRCFLWVKGPLLFACKPSHHSISQTFSTFYARKLYSPWPPLIFRSIMLLGYYCHTTLWA